MLDDLPPVTLVLHGSSNFHESSNVATGYKGWQGAIWVDGVCLGGLHTSFEAVLHDSLELCVDLFGGPGQALRVLSL